MVGGVEAGAGDGGTELGGLVENASNEELPRSGAAGDLVAQGVRTCSAVSLGASEPVANGALGDVVEGGAWGKGSTGVAAVEMGGNVGGDSVASVVATGCGTRG